VINLRMKRVNTILKEAIAEECRNLKDPRIGFLTITDVSTAPDLRAARVYYSILGDDAARASAAEGLSAASSRVRLAVGRQVRMKYLPHLTFLIDPSIEEGARIEKILSGLRNESEDEA
jgi:ribosome-binding factor A